MDGVMRISLERIHKFKPQSELFFVAVAADTALVADTFKFRRIRFLDLRGNRRSQTPNARGAALVCILL